MSGWRKALAVVYAAYLVLLGFVLLNVGQTGMASWAVRTLDRLLFDTPGRHDHWIEFGLNLVLFVPLGMLGLWLFRRTRVGDWAALGFLLSTAVEVTQRYLLPARFGEARDVVANTAGTLLGAAVGWGLLQVCLRARSAPRSDRAAVREGLRPPADDGQ